MHRREIVKQLSFRRNLPHVTPLTAGDFDLPSTDRSTSSKKDKVLETHCRCRHFEFLDATFAPISNNEPLPLSFGLIFRNPLIYPESTVVRPS